MVICDGCKNNVGTTDDFEAYDCDECGGEYCKKCCTEYYSGMFCKTHAPSCSGCKAKLTDDASCCTSCDSELCDKCIIHADGEDFCNGCAPKCKECNKSLTSYDLCEQCEEAVCKTCQIKTKRTEEIGERPTTVILCKTHGAEFNERVTENKIVIEYVIKLFKELRLVPNAIDKNLSLDEDDLIAQFELKNGEWTAVLSMPKVGRIDIDIESEDFSTTIHTTTYSHETALADIRSGIMKVAKGAQIALTQAFKEKRDTFLDDLALCDTTNMHVEGKKMIAKIEEMLKQPYNKASKTSKESAPW